MTTPAATACPKTHCYAPQTTCILGDDLEECPEYGSLRAADAVHAPEKMVGLLPWTGLGLGADDVAAVAGVGRPSLVALVGAASAGKTTALATTFLALRRGESLGGWCFAGSFTLLGWQIVLSSMQWPPHGNGGFPSHTVAVDVRSPCLLHLRLRHDTDGARRELLLSDVPGEWFSGWAIDSNNSGGAAWLTERADAFLLFADSEALSSSQRGQARADYDALARRLHSVVSDRPVLPVLSKADLTVPTPMREHLAHVTTGLFSAEPLPISVRTRSEGSPKAVIEKAVNQAFSGSGAGSTTELAVTTRHDDCLLTYRSWATA